MQTQCGEVLLNTPPATPALAVADVGAAVYFDYAVVHMSSD